MRKQGFYFVKAENEWSIGKWRVNEEYSYLSRWEVLGFFDEFRDEELDEIGDGVLFPRKYDLQSHPEMG